MTHKNTSRHGYDRIYPSKANLGLDFRSLAELGTQEYWLNSGCFLFTLAFALKARPWPWCHSVSRVARSNFVVAPENLGIRIWQKKRMNYDKVEIAAKLRKSQMSPECFLFNPIDRCYMIFT